MPLSCGGRGRATVSLDEDVVHNDSNGFVAQYRQI